MKIYLYIDARIQHALDLETLVEELETVGYTVFPVQRQGGETGLAAGAAFNAEDVIVILQPLHSEQLRVPAILEKRIIKIGVTASPSAPPGQLPTVIHSQQIAETILAQIDTAPRKRRESVDDKPSPAKPITLPPIITEAQPPAEKDFIEAMQATLQRWIDALTTHDMMPQAQPALPDTGGGFSPEVGETDTTEEKTDEADQFGVVGGSPNTEISPSPAKTSTNTEGIPALERFYANEKHESDARLKDAVQFSAYYPHAAQPEKRYGLFVYAHTADTLTKTQQDAARFEDELGGSVPPPKTARQTADIEAGTVIRVMPECDEIEFDPPYLEKKWRGDWTRYEFEFMPQQKQVGESLWVRVSLQIAGIEIAHIKCDIAVTDKPAQTRPQPKPDIEKSSLLVGDAMPDNPLAVAKLKSATARIYQKIFISYSRHDTEVAHAYRLAQMAAGHEVFLDTENIRTGEDWQAALAKAIDEADIFQLFWSEHSAASPNVRDEWDYCLTYKCVEDECRGFIRPVYWKKPMPVPPPELGHLNFRFVPLQSEENG